MNIRKTPFSLSISHHHIFKVHIGIRWHLKIGFLKGIFEASAKQILMYFFYPFVGDLKSFFKKQAIPVRVTGSRVPDSNTKYDWWWYIIFCSQKIFTNVFSDFFCVCAQWAIFSYTTKATSNNTFLCIEHNYVIQNCENFFFHHHLYDEHKNACTSMHQRKFFGK